MVQATCASNQRLEALEKKVHESKLQVTIAAYQGPITDMETGCASARARAMRAHELLQQVDLDQKITETQVLESKMLLL
jgi:hypothetical protein